MPSNLTRFPLSSSLRKSESERVRLTADAARVMYISSHTDGVSTYNDPRTPLDVEYEYPETRIITLHRDPHLGFGFVAGSERPVVVRCVTEGEGFIS